MGGMESLTEPVLDEAEAAYQRARLVCPVLGSLAMDMGRDMFNLSGGQWHGDTFHEEALAEAEVAAERDRAVEEVIGSSTERRSVFDSFEYTATGWFSRSASTERMASEPITPSQPVAKPVTIAPEAETVFVSAVEQPAGIIESQIKEPLIEKPEPAVLIVNRVEEVPPVPIVEAETKQPVYSEVIVEEVVVTPAETTHEDSIRAAAEETQRAMYSRPDVAAEVETRAPALVMAAPEVVRLPPERIVESRPEPIIEAVELVELIDIAAVREAEKRFEQVVVEPVAALEAATVEPVLLRPVAIPERPTDIRTEREEVINQIAAPIERSREAAPVIDAIVEQPILTEIVYDVAARTVPAEMITDIYDIQDEAVRAEVQTVLSRLPHLESVPFIDSESETVLNEEFADEAGAEAYDAAETMPGPSVAMSAEPGTPTVERPQNVQEELVAHELIIDQLTRQLETESEVVQPLVEEVAQAMELVESIITDPESNDEMVVAAEAELVVACRRMLRQLGDELPAQEVRSFARRLLVADVMHAAAQRVADDAGTIREDLLDELGAHEHKHFGVALNWRRLMRTVRRRSGHYLALGRLSLASAT